MEKAEIVLFETGDKQIKLSVPIEQETVWLNRNQMAKFATTTRHGAVEGKTQMHMTDFYNLDIKISVGYRVKSKRGVDFRKWANSVLKKYILEGYAVNNNRINQLGEVIRIMKCTENHFGYAVWR